MNPYRLTDPVPGESWRTRLARERAERARLLKRRKPYKDRWPVGWEPPF